MDRITRGVKAAFSPAPASLNRRQETCCTAFMDDYKQMSPADKLNVLVYAWGGGKSGSSRTHTSQQLFEGTKRAFREDHQRSSEPVIERSISFNNRIQYEMRRNTQLPRSYVDTIERVSDDTEPDYETKKPGYSNCWKLPSPGWIFHPPAISDLLQDGMRHAGAGAGSGSESGIPANRPAGNEKIFRRGETGFVRGTQGSGKNKVEGRHADDFGKYFLFKLPAG
jgi:hypothetical protein